MSEPSRFPESDHEAPPRMPRWVKVGAIIVGILILAVVAVMVFGGGNHGPGRHTPGGMPGGVEAPAAPGNEAAQMGALPTGHRG